MNNNTNSYNSYGNSNYGNKNNYQGYSNTSNYGGSSNYPSSSNYSNSNYSNSNYNKYNSSSPSKVSNQPVKVKDEIQFGGDLDFDLTPQQNNSGFSNGLDFGANANVNLKEKSTNNSRRRSARKFLEENDNMVFANKGSTSNNNPASSSSNLDYQFNNRDNDIFNNYSHSNPRSFGSDFGSRRAMGGVSSGNMMVGDSSYGGNKGGMKKSENSVLFGMESRRGHK